MSENITRELLLLGVAHKLVNDEIAKLYDQDVDSEFTEYTSDKIE